MVCIVVSICELLYVSDNRERSKGKSQSAVAKNLKNSKDVPVGSVVALTEECDVIEFEAIAAGRTVRFGASSDYDRGRKVQFFDKEYYVKEKTYKTVEEYEKALRDIAFDGNLKIYRVDGVPVNSYPKLKNAGVDQV
ncbi:MAG: hypothetical protein IJK33_00775 [Clostridia bacterium]|nr:hypothetical protein [Clostridia bacterium]